MVVRACTDAFSVSARCPLTGCVCCLLTVPPCRPCGAVTAQESVQPGDWHKHYLDTANDNLLVGEHVARTYPLQPGS